MCRVAACAVVMKRRPDGANQHVLVGAGGWVSPETLSPPSADQLRDRRCSRRE
jgi:hypothetical protein